MDAVVLKFVKKLSACERSGLADLNALLGTAEADFSSTGNGTKAPHVDRYFKIFKAAFDSKRPQLMEIALSAVHVLITRGYLMGAGTLYVGSGDAKGNSNINTNSNNNINSSSGSGEDKTSTSTTDDGTASTSTSASASAAPSTRERRGSVSKKSSQQRTDMDYFIESVSHCSEVNDDGVHLQTIKVLLTAITCVTCEVHEATLLLAIQACFHIHLVSRNSVNKITAKAALTQMVSSINMDLEVAEGKDDYNAGGIGADGVSADGVHVQVPGQGATTGGDMVFPSIAYKDSYLVFRALCKLSMKGIHDDSDLALATRVPQGSDADLDVSAVAVQNKILSLELILHILEKCGHAFQGSERIVDAVRKYLCMSLLGNCTSQVTHVAALSLRVFVALMERFKSVLKTEFEVFFTSVLFKILDSENSTVEHKIRVMEVFHKISADKATLMEFFINYDCDLDTSDVFRRIVACFARLAKNPVATNATPAEKEAVKKMGIKGLVLILRSLLESKGITIDDEASPKGVGEAVAAATAIGAAPADASDGSASPNPEDEMALSMTAVDAFDRKQKKQEQIEVGIIKFAMSPKKGIDYLVNVGYLENTPEAVAKFILYEEKLDKTQIGDYIGREPEYCGGFCLKVLHEYVELLDFQKLPFDLAIRYFLRGFRLPGEAQKIDRIMEKFAERYYLQNQEEFASADMAFILAFSTIMLQTNLHNPAIKDEKRMTKEQFLRQNTGITSDGELSHDLLGSIYDRIKAEPISMTDDKKPEKETDAPGFAAFQPSEESRRMDAFNDERKEMMRKGQSLFRKNSSSKNVLFVTSSKTNAGAEAYVRPMFEAAWAPIMAALSHIFEAESDPDIVNLCLMGFKCATRLACRLDLPVVRATYINALAKCTALDLPRMMQTKNAESVKIVLDIARTEREYLGESWLELLNCISQMARLLQFDNGSACDDVFFSNDSERGGVGRINGTGSSPVGAKAKASGGIFSFFSSSEPPVTMKQMEESNAGRVMNEVNIADIDRIFHTSHQLSGESVMHFVRALCAVSIQEINSYSSIDVLTSSHSSQPRIFSLQKLVEVADFNMHSRSRLQWGAIWKLLADHFTVVGTLDNQMLAMYAIDSLKQLSIKFLQKEELSNFNFQRVFLKPFEVIIMKSSSVETKDLILHCIEIMILACAHNIRSGWRSIFSIFAGCANQQSTEVATMALHVIEKLMSNRFELLFQDFVEVVNCFVVFSSSRHEELALQSLTHLAFCADKLAADGNSERFSKGASRGGEDATVFRLWWPLLLGLSARVGDSRPVIRIKAFETLSHVLKTHGSAFSVDAWKMLFKGVLFPMMDSAKTDLANVTMSAYPTENPFLVPNSSSWIDSVGLKVLTMCLEFFQTMEPLEDKLSVLPDLLSLLDSCICQEAEVLARMGVSTLGDMLLYLGEMDATTAERACSYLCETIAKNLCTNFGPAGSLSLSGDYSKKLRAKALLQCPVQARRSTQCDEKVRTAYGYGTIVAYAKAVHIGSAVVDSRNSVPTREVVQLPWGTLYGQKSNFVDSSAQTTEIVSAPVWGEVARSAMTSMIVSIDIMHVLKAVFDTQNDSTIGFSVEQLERILDALEASHWHARSFNEDERLSLLLQSMNFMHFKGNPGRPPNVLEQEIRTASLILVLAHRLHAAAASDTAATAADVDLSASALSRSEEWIRRYTDIVILRYVELDSSLQSSAPIADDLINAYKPTVMETLTRLSAVEAAQLESYESWIVPLITKLILCSDFEIRATVADMLSKIAHKEEGDSVPASPVDSP